MIQVTIEYNGTYSSRDGEVIRLHGPPPGLARELAYTASLNKEVISATLIDESGKHTRFCKGEIIPSPISSAPDAPPF